jgi:serine/threonine-protein kinase
VVRRRPTDQRLDIFSFGVSAYELLTGQLPWKRGSDGMAAMAHDAHKPVPIQEYRPQTDPTLAKAIMQCLAVDPADRPQSMQRFLQSIRSVKTEDAR